MYVWYIYLHLWLIFMVDVGKYIPYVDAMCYDNDSFILKVWCWWSFSQVVWWKNHNDEFWQTVRTVPLTDCHMRKSKGPKKQRQQSTAKYIQQKFWMGKSWIFGPISFSGWWLNQPIWKICSSNWVHLPQMGVKIKNIWNHHLVLVERGYFLAPVSELNLRWKTVTAQWPSSCICSCVAYKPKTFLVGGFNPFEKY